MSTPNITKTWYHFLPEVGRNITRQADDIVSIMERHNRIRRELAALEEEQQELEEDLTNQVTKDWTPGEIREAIDAYKQFLKP